MRRFTAGPRPDAVRAVAALQDDTRRAVYEAVCQRDGPATRDDVAAATGLSRRSAAFHLDELAGHGLLAVTFRRLSGRSGPGAGRPSKLYAPSGEELLVSVPPREYDLAGEVLAAAVTACLGRDDPDTLRAALRDAARDAGRALGSEAASRGRDVVAVLTEHGFAPAAAGSGLELRNCPFHRLARRYVDVVCGINLELARGIADGLGDRSLVPTLDPAPGRCCVVLTGA